MDPSIMKFLEEDEDETMHSGADVDAFTAALNRDIEGDNNNNNNTSTSQSQSQAPTSSDAASALSQATNDTPSQIFQKWQSSISEEENKLQKQEKQSFAMEPIRQISGSETQHYPNDTAHDISQQSKPQEDQHNVYMSQALSSGPQDIGQPNRLQNDQHNVHMSQAMVTRPQDIGQLNRPQADQRIGHVSQAMSSRPQDIGQPNMHDQNNNHMSHAMNSRPQDVSQPSRPQVDQHNVHMSEAMNSRPQDISQPSRPQGDQHNVHMSQAMSSRPEHLSQPSKPQDDQHNVHMSQAMNMQNTADKNPAQNITRNLENESQLQRMQRMSNQQAMQKAQAANTMNRPPSGKQVPFAMLLPVIEPQLDKDRAMQLQGLYNRLKSNNINKEEFVRHMRTLVGDHMLKMAVYKLQQGQIPKVDNASNRFPHPTQHPAIQNTQKPSPYVATSSIHQSSDSSSLPMDNAQKSRLLEHHSDTAIKQQQQHMHFPQSSFPTYGNPGGNYPAGSNPNMNISPQLQMRQGPGHPSMGSQPMNPMSLSERQNVLNEMKRINPGGLAHFANNSPNSGHWQPSMGHGKPDSMDQMNNQQHKSQGIEQVSGSSKDDSFEMSSRPGFSTPLNKPEPKSITAQLERQNVVSVGNSSVGPGSNVKTPPKKPIIGQKKPLETPAFSLSKKQKVSGAFSDQSIEQLNDVTAVSGVNLKEEEEHLFSGSKEDSRASEASRKVVQEEEERLILQKIPLERKLAEIMGKCGVKNISGDVERCLSLCVEERMRGLISNLIRLSKQRVDIEKSRHRIVITSDVRQQIMSMNQKAREEWEKTHAVAEKLQRTDESEGDGEDGRGKSFKVNKEEDDKMRTTAANVAARAAVGGDDMLSKWQLMAEQARQKRDGGPDASSSSSTSQPIVNIDPKPVSVSDKNTKENPDIEKTSVAVTATPGPARKTSKNPDLPRSSSIPRSISVKDVIAVLSREVQMSRSTLIYRLYEKVPSDSTSE